MVKAYEYSHIEVEKQFLKTTASDREWWANRKKAKIPRSQEAEIALQTWINRHLITDDLIASDRRMVNEHQQFAEELLGVLINTAEHRKLLQKYGLSHGLV